MRHSMLLAVLVLTLSTACRAPRVEARSEPTPARAFDWTIGTWSGARRAGDTGEVEPMRMTVAPMLDGAGQTRDMAIGAGDDPYRGFCAQFFAPSRGVWVREYTNASRERFTELEGEIDARDPGRSVWHVSSPSARLSELVSERPSANAWVRTMSISTDGGATWSVLWVDTLERVNDFCPSLLARIIHEHARQKLQSTGYAGLSAPAGTLRTSASSTT